MSNHKNWINSTNQETEVSIHVRRLIGSMLRQFNFEWDGAGTELSSQIDYAMWAGAIPSHRLLEDMVIKIIDSTERGLSRNARITYAREDLARKLVKEAIENGIELSIDHGDPTGRLRRL